MAPPKKLPPTARPNPLRNRKQISAPVALSRQAKATVLPPKRGCPNQTCNTPDVQDGVCHSCGTIIDDSNIVSEVQFGETSSGAAVVQGSYLSADQGTARSLGPAFKRAGGMEARETTLREGRQLMSSYVGQLQISEVAMNAGLQIFKLAAMNNFIQGRRMEIVAAVCLYSGCRAHPPCRIMLIDFADKIQVNVFKLGRTFKALHRTITLAADGLLPILPEDLIWRFSNQLDFGTLTNRVAEDAVRIAQRMSLDWMVMGRRPSGVCGACIILAARMHNFRRTVTEVVYIVKVTTVTIQKRLEEFKVTQSSALTVDEFLNNEFLESAHDPPSFYEKSEEFQKTKKKRKRRNKTYGDDEEEDEDDAINREENEPSSKRQKMITAPPRLDADGFAIPAQPIQSHDIPIDPQLSNTQPRNTQTSDSQGGDISLDDPAIQERTGESIEKLVAEFGDHPEMSSLDEQMTIDSSSNSKKQTPRAEKEREEIIEVSNEWAEAEDRLANEIGEMISAPSSLEHAEAYARTRNYALEHVRRHDEINPPQNVSMEIDIGEDEFAHDIEVQGCLLSPEEAAKKEQLWVNANKDWLRKQQLKEWKKRQAANGPPKARRNRKKKPRIGEGQTTPAASPAEAAESVLKARSFSKKINYEALHSMFESIHKMQGLGSAGTSRVTSRAGSDIDGSEVSGSRAGSVALSTAGDHDSTPLIRGPKSRSERTQEQRARAAAAKTSSTRTDSSDEEGADESDYVQPTGQPIAPVTQAEDEPDWRAQVRASRNGEEDQDDEEDAEDYNEDEMGDIDDDAVFDDGDVVRGFGGNDMDEDEEYD